MKAKYPPKDTINETFYRRTVEKLLIPYRKEWELRNYSLVVERGFAINNLLYRKYPELYDIIYNEAVAIETAQKEAEKYETRTDNV